MTQIISKRNLFAHIFGEKETVYVLHTRICDTAKQDKISSVPVTMGVKR